MRIKSAKRAYALHFSGILPGGGYSPKVQQGGSTRAGEELLHELAIVMSPYNKLKDFHKKWAEYIYADESDLYKKGYLKPYLGVVIDEHILSLFERVNKDTEWKISRLVEIIIDDFRSTERCGERMYSDADYCRRTGIDSGNYTKYWKEVERDILDYLSALSRIVLMPIADKIEELKEREQLDKAV